jgi:hypothetical protein
VEEKFFGLSATFIFSGSILSASLRHRKCLLHVKRSNIKIFTSTQGIPRPISNLNRCRTNIFRVQKTKLFHGQAMQQ